MHIGPTVDLRNYEKYYEKFKKDLGSEPRCMEFHIIESDLTPELKQKMKLVNEFLKDKNLAISFHCPDHPLNALTKARLENKNPDYAKLMLLADALKQIKQKKFLVVHQGFIADRDVIEAMPLDVLVRMKKAIKTIAAEELSIINKIFSNMTDLNTKSTADKLAKSQSDLAIGAEILLEQSPVFAGANKLVHITDQCFEDFSNRNFRMVMDISHIALLVHYFKQNKIAKSPTNKAKSDLAISATKQKEKLNWMEVLKKEYNGIPKSLQSIESYLQMAKEKTAWFHLSDANGIYVANEGLVIKDSKSTIDWNKIIKLIKDKEFGVLEILGCEKDYAKIQKSLKYLRMNNKELFTHENN
ncbi:MAG: hypothetical protein HZB65_02915 [Candidatus Aenigmarchaeota archaeon]|nr:hypothetical protein [Candidatus Aenigmarchaeota archaeon]